MRMKLRRGFWPAGIRARLSCSLKMSRERVQKWLARELPSSVANGIVVRLLGTELLTVRIDLDE